MRFMACSGIGNVSMESGNKITGKSLGNSFTGRIHGNKLMEQNVEIKPQF